MNLSGGVAYSSVATSISTDNGVNLSDYYCAEYQRAGGPDKYVRERDWTITTACFGCCLALSVYVLGCFALYEHRIRNGDGNRRKRFGRRRNRITQLMRALIFGAQILAALRFVIELLEATCMELFVREYCDLVRKAQVVLFTTAMTWIFLVLWIRQHGLYRMSGQQFLRSGVLRVVSVLVPVLMMVSNVFCTALYLNTKTFLWTSEGCSLCKQTVSSNLSTLLLLVNEIFFQGLLLALLILPLIRHRIKTRKVMVETSTRSNHNRALIVRATVCTCVAALFNGLATFAIIKSEGMVHKSYHQLIYDVDFFVTELCVCVTFSDWRCRLLPCWYRDVDTYQSRYQRSISLYQQHQQQNNNQQHSGHHPRLQSRVSLVPPKDPHRKLDLL